MSFEAPSYAAIRQGLEQAGVVFQPGLTTEELRSIEVRYRFRFPPDFESFLRAGLPTGCGFTHWREDPEEKIRERLEWPYEGMCFDIERNGFWMPDWGRRPASDDEAFAVARVAVNAAPRLIPVLGHRYLPDEPLEAGNPVISIYQTDIIYYGSDLQNYLMREFGYYFGRPPLRESDRETRFWSRIINGEGWIHPGASSKPGM